MIMNQHIQLKPLYYALCVVTVSIIIYLLSMFGLFEGYDHFFGKTHPHKWHSLFRMCFVIIFALVNHWFLVPQLYIKKRYILFFSIVLLYLVTSLVLPDLVITPPNLELPKLEPPKLFDGSPHSFPMRTLMFDLVHMYLFFFISILTSIVIRSRPYEQQIEQQTPKNIAYKEEAMVERQIETALTVTVNYSLVRIEFSDILFIKSMDNYLQFHLKDKKPILVRMTLKEAIEKLPTTEFLRVHKSYIVATAAIESIRNKIILIEKQDIPIGKAYEESFFKVFIQ